MKPFVFNCKTKVVFEENAVLKLGSVLKEENATKVLVVYGGSSAKKSGLLDKVFENIKSENIDYVTLGDVQPNPLLSKVYEGIEISKCENVDFILAVGGGSVIDTCKAIAVGVLSNIDIWKHYEGALVTDSLPVGCILTIPAAGSEMSTSSVITHDDTKMKRSMNFIGAVCKFSLLDPSLTLSLPEYQTFCGVTDIIMHTLERYLNNDENLELTDSFAQSLIKTVIKYALILVDDPNNLEARWNVMWAGSLSHNGLLSCGNNKGDWATHKIEHELSGLYDVAHGAGLAAVWGSWARYVKDIIPHRFAKLGRYVFEMDSKIDDDTLTLMTICAFEDFFKSIKMPINITDLVSKNILEEDIILMSEKATDFGEKEIGTVKILNSDDVKNILISAIK